MNLSLKEMPTDERPRERLLKYGAEVLTNTELLAILLRSGTKSANVLEIANKLLSTNEGLTYISTATMQELSSFNGVGFAKAAQIKAAIELGKRLRTFRMDNRFKINKPEDAIDLLIDDMRYLKKEHLRVIFLNTKNVVIDVKDLSIGSLNSSVVHPREVFSEAIRKSSASIIICHNHPSGDPQPSSEDINITKRLFEVGKLVGIELLDHIIIGDGNYISLKEKGIIS